MVARAPRAERAGFEPANELAARYSLSRRVPSATRPPLREPPSVEAPPRARLASAPQLGGVAERLNAAVLKTVGPGNRSRGFESLPLRSAVERAGPGPEGVGGGTRRDPRPRGREVDAVGRPD